MMGNKIVMNYFVFFFIGNLMLLELDFFNDIAISSSRLAAASPSNRVLCMAGQWPETALTVKRQRCAATPQRRVCFRRWQI
jgi:hypothetical protein